MPEKGIRSTYSQCPFEIQMWDDDEIISTGSGFFYEVNGRWFLITNWHNLSGKHFISKQPLNPNNRFPTLIKVKLFSYVGINEGNPQNSHFSVISQNVAIYEDQRPLWLEHPILGSSCDVVAIPFERPRNCPDFMHNAANRISTTKIPVEPGCTVFIIGFPRSISVGPGLPLWKSGYIASEPFYDVTVGGKVWEFGGLMEGIKLPAFFIDSQTREGMSGSPVFAHFIGAWDNSDPYKPLNMDEPGFWKREDIAIFGSTGTQFIGCYSGRVGTNEEGAALGLCWREDVIRAVCNGRQAQHPHVDANSHQ